MIEAVLFWELNLIGIGNFDYMHFFIGENLYFGPFKNNNNIEEILH
jgi:hypothetical protein